VPCPDVAVWRGLSTGMAKFYKKELAEFLAVVPKRVM
jgi:hypothetical protein